MSNITFSLLLSLRDLFEIFFELRSIDEKHAVSYARNLKYQRTQEISNRP